MSFNKKYLLLKLKTKLSDYTQKHEYVFFTKKILNMLLQRLQFNITEIAFICFIAIS